MTARRVLAIVGPTCTGKTALSLYLAQHFPAEIICCDSRNIYKGIDIASAKPSLKEQEQVPHHLIDVVEPNREFTAAEYAELAGKAIEEISERGKLPIVCGGTGFYAQALLEGLAIPNIAPDQELRRQLKNEEERNTGFLHRKLQDLDPPTAARLNPKDHFRLIRALEVSIKTGSPFSELAGQKESPYKVLWIGLSVKNRELLKTLIAARLKEQMEQGVLAELQKNIQSYQRNRLLTNTVNYRDLLKYLDGDLSLEQALAEIEKHNYQLARRQIMWFKRNAQINWFFVDEEKREKIELSARALAQQLLNQEP